MKISIINQLKKDNYIGIACGAIALLFGIFLIIIPELNVVTSTFASLAILVISLFIYLKTILYTNSKVQEYKLSIFAIAILTFGIITAIPNYTFVFAVVFIIYGIVLILHSIYYHTTYISKHPKTIELAEVFDQDIIFENKYVKISNQAIVNKKNPVQIGALNDVIGIYETTDSLNSITTSHKVCIFLIDGSMISIGVYGVKKAIIQDLIYSISNYCENAAVGYSSETLDYIRKKRKEYKMLNNNL